MILVLACLAALGGGEPLPGQSSSFEFRASPAAQVTVDGELTESVWAEAEVIPLPFETYPGSNEPAPVATRCRVAYDAETLYLGCEARDPAPAAIRAYLSDRDELDGQDGIVLGLSPFEDGRRAFLFRVNPLGVQQDAMYNEGSGSDRSWDAIWASSGRLTAAGYVVEVGIPFRSLRFPARSGEQSWAFYVERYWPRDANVRVQTFRESDDEACRLCQVNRLAGLTGITPGRNVQVTPTISASQREDRPLDAGDWTSPERELDAGLDVAWGITTDIRLNATVNPDFSQVEADVAQLDANRRFALFFPERRPFFQEGADLFSTPMRLAFTRSIVDPDGGGKLTGKVGGNAFGALIARDAVTSLLLPGPYGSGSEFVERGSWTSLLSYRRDLTHTAALGGLATVRQGPGYHNVVGSLDASFQPHPSVRVQLQYARSDTDPLTAAADGSAAGESGPSRFGGQALHAQAVLDTRRWFGQVGMRRIDGGFRADAGFMPVADRVSQWAWTSRRWFGTSSSMISQVRLAGGGWWDHTIDGTLIHRGGWLTGSVEGPWQSRLTLNPNLSEERFDGTDYRLANVRLSAGVRPASWLGAQMDGQAGRTIDYANGRPARELRVEPALTVRPGRHLAARASYGYQRLDTEEGERILDAGVARLRLVYSFSARMFVRAIVQHRRTDRDPARFTGPVPQEQESALSQLLFSYKLNPQTVLFLGYSDDREGLRELNQRPIGLRPTGRTLFLKVGYALRP